MSTVSEKFVGIVRGYGLAILCIVGPVATAYCSLEFATRQLFPKDGIGLNWQLQLLAPKPFKADASAAKPGADTAPAAPEASDEQKKAAEKASQRVVPKASRTDPRLEPLALQIVGRHTFAAMTAFLQAASFVVFAVGLIAVHKQFGLRGASWAIVVSIVFGLVLAEFSSGNDEIRTHLVDNVLKQSDGSPLYCPTNSELCAETNWAGVKAFGDSATRTAELVHWNTRFGFIATFALLFGLAAISIRPAVATAPGSVSDDVASSSAKLNDLSGAALRKRGAMLRLLLLAAALLFFFVVVTSKASIEWPISLVAEPTRASLEQIGKSLLELWGAAYTLVLLMAFGPAFAAWYADREAYRALPEDARKARDGGAKVDDGLDILPMSTITSIATLALPVLATPIADVIKKFFEVVSK